MSAQNISEHPKIPVITPGSGNKPPTGKRPVRQGIFLRVLVLLILAVLVVLAIGVFTVFPRMVAEPPRHVEAPAATPDVRQPPTSEPSEQALSEQRTRAEKRAAEEALGRVLRRQTELEAEGVTHWGGDDYGAVGLRVERADAFFAEAQFAAARDAYDEAVAALDALEASKPERLDAALAAGVAALSLGDGEGAAKQFAIASSIDPTNAEAEHGARRALSIVEVFERIETAFEHEEKQELELARSEFARALELDPEVLRAAQGLERVTDKLEALQFRRSMSEALSAIDTQDFESARRALDTANELRPDATEVADARRRLNQAYEAAQIRRHQRRARDYEKAELWEQAHAEYTAVLAIDNSLQFAQRGTTRTGELAALDKEMAKFLREPVRVYDPNSVKHVQSLLDHAASLSPAGPTLAANTQRLRGLLTLAETPIAVSLASDNQTHVIVYKVGELGRFTTRTLQLRPGSYIAVGQRVGYRDVRVAINVLPGESAGPFVIRCQERI